MKIQDLKKMLVEKQVPDNLYNLEGAGRKDERFCLEKVDDKWRVYYSERGVKTTDKVFELEEDACQFILDQLIG